MRSVTAAAGASGSMSAVSGSTVHEHRRGADASDRFGGGDEGVGRQDELVADATPSARSASSSASVPLADTHAVPDAGPRGVVRLERGHAWAPDERGVRQDVGPAGGDLVGHLGVGGRQVQQRHRVCGGEGTGHE